ncbi:hypothetical protein E2C01_056599 [Portunus trituberculatus]|uniref:Uncharacterized protein n=1 Tax=Portunus trituberculatus TaxID=210409 RepID=A0A5B7H105_PORTR|nr:hypothetical protein [Portunus trituberculatus]
MEAIGPYHQLVNSGLDFGTLISENQEEEITSSFSSRKASVKKSNSINKAILSERILRERKRTDSTSSTHQLEESILGSSISLHDSVEADNILTISGAHTTGSSTAISSGMSNSSYNDSKAVSVKTIINCVSKFILQLTGNKLLLVFH